MLLACTQGQQGFMEQFDATDQDSAHLFDGEAASPRICLPRVCRCTASYRQHTAPRPPGAASVTACGGLGSSGGAAMCCCWHAHKGSKDSRSSLTPRTKTVPTFSTARQHVLPSAFRGCVDARPRTGSTRRQDRLGLPLSPLAEALAPRVARQCVAVGMHTRAARIHGAV